MEHFANWHPFYVKSQHSAASENCWSREPLTPGIPESGPVRWLTFTLQTFPVFFYVPGIRGIRMAKTRPVPALTLLEEWLIRKPILEHIMDERKEGLGETLCFWLLTLALKNELDFARRIKDRTFREHSRDCWNKLQRAKAWKDTMSLWNVCL